MIGYISAQLITAGDTEFASTTTVSDESSTDKISNLELGDSISFEDNLS